MMSAAGAGQGGQRLLNVVGRVLGMAVQTHDELAARLAQSEVEGTWHDAARIVEQADACIALGILLHDGARPVGACAIDAEDLNIRPVANLRENGVEAALHKRLFVPHRNNDRNQHRFPLGP